MNKNFFDVVLAITMANVKEGIHVVDQNGTTIIYNKAMEEIEGMAAEEVIGKHILKAYSGWQDDNSTLLSVLKTGQPIHRSSQKYLNLAGKPIVTVNTTLPLYDGDTLIGALEIAGNVTEVSDLSEELIKLRQQLIKPQRKSKSDKHYSFDMLIGEDPKYLRAVKQAFQAARSSSNVLIYGETGTGKELFAQSIHSESERSNKPFIAVNCAALPETLLEATLFGTTRGSFTGAVDRPGIFEQADGGTLFLDELNSMSLNLQSKLLRVLQENYIRRIGGLRDIAVDVRIIAATNQKPKTLLASGELRHDLYYRINVMSISIPSLRERPRDIDLLISRFLYQLNKKLGKDVWYIDEEITPYLYNYDWKGNVRELLNFLESALNMVGDERIIKREHLPLHWQDIVTQTAPKPVAKINQYIEPIDKSNGQYVDLNREMARIEKQIIVDHFTLYNGNITKVAESLGISRQNLQYKLKKYNL